MQLAVEAGAKRTLNPTENKRDLADVPDAILTANPVAVLRLTDQSSDHRHEYELTRRFNAAELQVSDGTALQMSRYNSAMEYSLAVAYNQGAAE